VVDALDAQRERADAVQALDALDEQGGKRPVRHSFECYRLARWPVPRGGVPSRAVRPIPGNRRSLGCSGGAASRYYSYAFLLMMLVVVHRIAVVADAVYPGHGVFAAILDMDALLPVVLNRTGPPPPWR